MYDPSTAQFLRPDPLFEAGGHTNLYLYCANDPVNKIDPSGRTLIVHGAEAWAEFWTRVTGPYWTALKATGFKIPEGGFGAESGYDTATGKVGLDANTKIVVQAMLDRLSDEQLGGSGARAILLACLSPDGNDLEMRVVRNPKTGVNEVETKSPTGTIETFLNNASKVVTATGVFLGAIGESFAPGAPYPVLVPPTIPKGGWTEESAVAFLHELTKEWGHNKHHLAVNMMLHYITRKGPRIYKFTPDDIDELRLHSREVVGAVVKDNIINKFEDPEEPAFGCPEPFPFKDGETIQVKTDPDVRVRFLPESWVGPFYSFESVNKNSKKPKNAQENPDFHKYSDHLFFSIGGATMTVEGKVTEWNSKLNRGKIAVTVTIGDTYDFAENPLKLRSLLAEGYSAAHFLQTQLPKYYPDKKKYEIWPWKETYTDEFLYDFSTGTIVK